MGKLTMPIGKVGMDFALLNDQVAHQVRPGPLRQTPAAGIVDRFRRGLSVREMGAEIAMSGG
ncbi:hypothetical protein OOK27_29780 [Streptomyces canus]|uniref:hypothetical protein n=1 Tax=Streptomyces canus TaxID=58343 RepID=UPI002257AD1C|nr:hypothetical protein [Streptomyces canus]MCX5258262.1 hypothetical protein [Streptomyces canus]